MTVNPVVVGGRDHDMVGEHAAAADAHRVDRVHVAVVPDVGVGANAQARRLPLGGQPRTIPDDHVVADADTRHALQHHRLDDDGVPADMSERLAKQRHARARELEPEPRALLDEQSGPAHLPRSFHPCPIQANCWRNTRLACTSRPRIWRCEFHSQLTHVALTNRHASAARPPICVRSGSVLGESGSRVARGAVAAILLSPHEFVALTRRKRDGRGVVCHDDLEIQHTLLALETLDQTPRRSDVPVVRNDGGDARSCYGAGSSTSGLPKRSYSATPRTKNPIDVKKTSPSCQAHTNSTTMAPSAARNSGRTV